MGNDLTTEILEESGADDLVRSFAGQIRERGGKLALPRLPMSAERLTIERLAARLRGDLEPIGNHKPMQKQALMVLGDLFTRYPSMRNDEAAMRCSAYLDDLMGFPIFAIRAACEDVKRGRIKGLSPEFPPTSPRIYEVAERHAAYVRVRLQAAERVLGVRELLPPPLSPEQQATIGAKLAALAEEFAANQAKLREELREKNRKAIQDAPGPTAAREYHGERPIEAAPGLVISPTLVNQIDRWRLRDAELQRAPKEHTVL